MFSLSTRNPMDIVTAARERRRCQGTCQHCPQPPEIVRFWKDDATGWVHLVRKGNLILAESRHRDELIEQYPDAVRNGVVICGDNVYICEAEAA